MYAVDDLSDAIDVTRNFLTPVSLGTWLRLAIVVFFLTGFGAGPQFPGGDFSGTEDPQSTETDPAGELPIDDETFITLVVFVVLTVIAIWIVFGIVGSIMEFVLYESMRSDEVHVRRYARANLGRGLWLFLFQVGLLLAFGVALALPAGLIYVAYSGIGDVALLGIVAFAFYAIAVFLAFGVVGKFTVEFVAPIMLLEERGPVSAWKRFWPVLVGDWKEYVVYALLSWIVGLVLGFGLSFVSIFVGVFLVIPVAIVGFLLIDAGTVGLVVAGFVALLGVVAFLLVISLLEVPIVSYLRYYALLVLGDVEEDLDLIPDQRRAVRSDGGFDDSDDGWGDGERDDAWGTDSSDSNRDSERVDGDSNDSTDDDWGTDSTDDDGGWR